jgi:PBSX family phage terminase large subunit
MAKPKRDAPFKFIPFSKKQKMILTWWIKGKSPVADRDVLVADGAVRSGKTLTMSLSFILWAMSDFKYKNFGMAGKTIGSFKRNVWVTLRLILRTRGYRVTKIKDTDSSNAYVISKGSEAKGTYVENYFYIFGGKDERSQDLVQGFTSAGFFFDEVALMPESFVNQAVARCSVEGRKLWFNCNPDGPFHWFKLEWIDKILDKNGFHLHFLLEDNPSLSPATIAFYKNMFKGVFYKRFILGLWVMAEGIIYDMFDDDNLYENGHGPDYNLYYNRYYSMDYGTTNPCVFLEIIEQMHDGKKYWYIEDEYYFNSREEGYQKSDDEYTKDFLKFNNGKPYKAVILDPSAASFKVSLRQAGVRVRDADNDVLDGIRLVATLFSLKRLKANKQKTEMLQKEQGSYIWNEKAALEHGKEEPVKENDHAMDAIRYFCKTIIKWILKK